MADYKVNLYIVSTSLIGFLIIVKVVLIFDLIPLTKHVNRLLNIYRVFLRSLIYLAGYVIFTFLEHLIKGTINGESFSSALDSTLVSLYSPAFITTYVGVFIAFLLFNAFWVVRASMGPATLFKLFFKKND
jgi:hypothetical protein